MGLIKKPGKTIASGPGRARSLGVMAKDVMEGYVTLNPLVIKKFDGDSLKELYRQVRRLQTTIRSEGLDLANQQALRQRNQKLQRMHQALSVLEHQAKAQRVALI
jgi:hypothetical protein